MIIRIVLVVIGILLILTVRFTEKPVSALLSVFKSVPPGDGENYEPDTGAEEDLLDNRKKWRFLIAGYAVFAIYVLLSIGAMFTLNRKINTLYGSITSMEASMKEIQESVKTEVSANGN